MNFKKTLSGLIASIMVFSSIPQTFVHANSDNKEQPEKNVQSNNVPDTNNLDELENERTAFTKTFKDENGKFYKEIYAEPIHTKQDGLYEEIDNSISVDQNNQSVVETENTALSAEFPKNIQKEKSIIFKKGKHRVEFELTSANKENQQLKPNALSKTILDDNKVQYNDIYPEIDLRHITFNEEVKEDWIIKKYTGINQFSYTLKTALNPILQKDGSISFFEKNDSDNPVFVLPAPEMMDSNINEKKGEGTYSNQVKYLLNENNDKSYNLTLDIDKEWLSSSNRVFPVYVDPTVSIDALGDAYISSKAPTTNFDEKWDPVQGEYVLQTGYYDSTSGTNYAFIKFSVANELKGAVIDSASLQAYVTHAYYATQKNGLWVDEANSKWAIKEINWNNKPSSTKISSTLVGRDEWAKLDVKSTLQAWVSEERPNTGFKLHTNGNGQTYWKKITASESANKPKLVISYHYDQMPTPTMSAQLDNATTKTGSVNVNWKSVFGASSYKLQMFDGYRYETVYTGSGLNWTSKDKKIFPKAPYSSSSRYKLDGTGTELPVDPSAFYSANLGSTTTTKAYKFRVVPVYPTGDGPTSTIISKEIPVPAGEPDLPTVTTGTYSETDTVNKGRGWLNVKWNKVTNATGYKVRIWNGSVYKNYIVGKDTTSISTKGKKIWPTDDQIKAGTKDLYDVNFDDATSVGKGAELPIDPSTTYGSSSSRYSVRVIAMSAAGDSPSSDVNYGYMKLYAPKNASVAANEDNLVQNKTSLTMKWSPSTGANYYEVQLNNGGTIEKFKVKGSTSFTTPKANYALGKTYSANVVAFFDDDETAYESEEDKVTGQRGLSDKSNTAVVQSDLRKDLNGEESYFTYDENEFGNATSEVNVTTGNTSFSFTDQELYTRGDLGYSFIRTYNSRSKESSVLGEGWTFSGNESLTENTDGNILYEDEDGTAHIFRKDGDKFISPKGLYLSLVKVNDAYKLSNDGETQIFKIIVGTKKYVTATYNDEFGNQINYTRNDKGQIVDIYQDNSLNSQEKIEFTYLNDKISKIKYGDKWISYQYTNNKLTKTILGNDKTTRTITEMFSYDENGQLNKYLDSKNNETSIKYNENEIVIFDKQADDAELSVTKTYKFNKQDNEYSVIDTDDSETIFKRDELNDSYVVAQENSPGEDGQNTITKYLFDDQYNVLKVTNPDNSTDINTYDNNGNLLTSTTKEGTQVHEYNANGKLIKTKEPNGEITQYLYNGPLLVSKKVGDNTTSFEYDQFGRVTKNIYSNNTFETIKYDDNLRKTILTDKKGNTTSETVSIYNQKIEETDASQNKKIYTYDPINSDIITSVTDGNGNKTSYVNDDNGNIKEVTDALGRIKKYEYNDNDQVTSLLLSNMKYEYQYDLNGKISQTTYPSGIQANYIYNNAGQVSQIENGNEKIAYDYDVNGNVSSIKKNDIVIKAFEYNPTSNVLSSVSQKDFSQKYQYDSLNRIIQETTNHGQNISILKKTDYKENSDEPNSLSYEVENSVLHNYQIENDTPNNRRTVSTNSDLLKQVSQMNDTNALSSIKYTSKTQVPYEISYEYTPNQQISKESINGKSSVYSYDSNNQLVKEVLQDGSVNTYTYDSVGNRTKANVSGKSNSYIYNDNNQIISKNGTVFVYDKDGNLLKDENYVYTYNEQQLLVEVKTKDNKLIAKYTYDDNGLRLSKTIGNTIYEYFYSENNLEMETIKVDNEVISYRFYEWIGMNPSGMIVKSKDSNGNFVTNAYQYITNYKGDILSIRDKNDKEVGSYQYDAYGNILNVEGNIAKENSLRYAGYYFDSETNNYYLQARYYNSANGSFLAIDPQLGDKEDPISQNGYTYGSNNPLMNVDPDGNLSRRVKYSLVTGLYFLTLAIFGPFVTFSFVLDIGRSFLKTFKSVKSSKTDSDVLYHIADIKSGGFHSKKIRKIALGAAFRAARQTAFPLTAGLMLFYFSQGLYMGYYKYYNYNRKKTRQYYKIKKKWNYAKAIYNRYHFG